MILIYKGTQEEKRDDLFPSPCGVLMILIELTRKCSLQDLIVSVPMRGFNDFNTAKIGYIRLKKVSVPMRGFNDFNKGELCYLGENKV